MITIINQPWGGPQERVGDILNRELAVGAEFGSFTIAVAFAKETGVETFGEHIQRFLAEGRGVEAFVGIDALGTSKEALALLLELGVTTHVFHNPGHTFHPKLYLLEGSHSAFAVVGSSNLTVGGLYTNYELGAGIRLSLTDEAHRVVYEQLRGVITSLRGSRNTKDLTPELLAELTSRGLLGSETRDEEDAEVEAEARRTRRTAGLAIFERTPVPPPPRSPGRRSSAPRGAAAAPTREAGLPTQFVMTFGPRDAGTRTGFSPDIFVPLAARDEERSFWRWPENYVQAGTTSGTYDERRVNILVEGTNGSVLVRGVRLYFYHQRSEFRLNCSELVALASPGDLLVLELLADPTAGADYAGSVVRRSSSGFSTYDAIAHNQVRNSTKRWGYA